MLPNQGAGQEFYLAALKEKAQEKRDSLAALLDAQQRIAADIERTSDYLQHLVKLLEAEGQKRVALPQEKNKGGIGRPGNRAEGMPLRKPEWKDMSLTQIAAAVLAQSKDALPLSELVHRIYEIHTGDDLRRAKRTLVSTMRLGVKRGRWQSPKQGQYQSTSGPLFQPI